MGFQIPDFGQYRAPPTWDQLAWIGLLRFLVRLREHWPEGAQFTVEEARDAAERMFGVPKPPDERAWGRIVQRAADRGCAVATGEFATSMRPSRKHAKVAIWRT